MVSINPRFAGNNVKLNNANKEVDVKETVEPNVEESTISAASASSNETKDVPLDTWKAYGGVNQKITKKVLLDTKESSKPQKTTYMVDGLSGFHELRKNTELKPGDIIIKTGVRSVETYIVDENGNPVRVDYRHW